MDIPNAFTQTIVENEKDRVIIHVRGHLVDVLTKITPEVYADYVMCNHRGEKQILFQCLNALYGTMVVSLFYYRKFTNSLIKHRFKVNPYDSCIWNKMVSGKQLTICFHVNDCKLSHVTSQVLEDTISWLQQDYESIFKDRSGKMKVHRGNSQVPWNDSQFYHQSESTNLHDWLYPRNHINIGQDCIRCGVGWF